MPFVVMIAVAYAPIPRTAACPNETWPAKPPTRFHAVAIAPYRKIRNRTSSAYSARGATNGTATNAAIAIAAKAPFLATAQRPQRPDDPLRKRDQDDDQHDERDQILHRSRHVPHAERLGDRERDRTERDADDRIESTQDDDAERFEREDAPEIRREREQQREQRAAEARQ